MSRIRVGSLYSQNPDGDQRGIMINLKDGEPIFVPAGSFYEIDLDQITGIEPGPSNESADAAAIMPRSDSPHTGRVPPEKFVEVFGLNKSKEPETPPANSALPREANLPNNEATQANPPPNERNVNISGRGEVTPAAGPGSNAEQGRAAPETSTPPTPNPNATATPEPGKELGPRDARHGAVGAAPSKELNLASLTS